MRPSSPRSSRISSTTARYSRSSSRVLTPGGSSSGCSSHLDPEPALRIGVGGAGDSAVQADETDGRAAAGQAHALGDLGDRADLCVLALVPRHEQDALLVADVGGDRDVHVREDDDVVKRDKQQRAQRFHHLSVGSYATNSSFRR